MAEIFDVFISYRRSDGEDLADSLYNYLDSRGVRVFLDKKKLKNGDFFDTQLREKLVSAPHYILIATNDAFEFRPGVDWVVNEMELAVSEMEKHPHDRTITVLADSKVVFPDSLPSNISRILDVQRIKIGEDNDTDAAFAEILETVTHVTRRNIWYAANNWLKMRKAFGGRFSKSKTGGGTFGNMLLRCGYDLPTEVRIGKKSGKTVPLLDAIKQTDGNLYLIGEGGIGKTTALIRIMEEAYKNEYSEQDQIPVFVELSFAPDKNGKWIEDRKSTFIFRSIYKQIIDRSADEQGSTRGVDELDEVFGIDPSVAVTPIRDLFTGRSPSPEYLLLLDGLNEVSHTKIRGGNETVIGLVLQEIKYIIDNCPNVRVILTSRSDETAMLAEGFTRIYFDGVNDDNIKKYLKNNGYNENRMTTVTENRDLMKTLRVPLFLTMYGKLKNTGVISTQGEILHRFFHERRDSIDDYTEQNRIADIGTNIASSEAAVENARLTADMQIFILDFILPRIGYEMEKNGLFCVSPMKLYEPILEVIKGRKNIDECGTSGSYVFPVIGRDGTEKSPKNISKSILDVFGGDEDEACGAILNCLVKSLGIFRITNGEYGFIHQYIRDYFAAVKYVNAMKLSAALYKNGSGSDARGLMDKHFKEKPLSLQIRRLTGETTGEHHNRSYCKNGRWQLPEGAEDSLIMKALDVYRISGPDNGRRKPSDYTDYGVYTLVRILNESRGELSGCDFSRIEFSLCNINGMRLSRKDLPAKFDKAVLSYAQLAFLGYGGRIRSAEISPDGRHIVTAGDNAVKIWDAESFALTGTIKGFAAMLSASYSPDGKYIMTASLRSIKIWDAKSLRHIRTVKTYFDIFEEVKSCTYSPDGKRILALSKRDKNIYEKTNMGKIVISEDSTRRVMIWDAKSFRRIKTIKDHPKSFEDERSFVYSPDGKRVLSSSWGNTAKIWDAESYELLYTLKGHSDGVFSVLYSPDGKRIITSSWDKTAKVWDAESFELLYTLKGHSKGVTSASYAPDGKRILTSSWDKTARIWDAESFELIGTLQGHSEGISFASYSSDGKRIVTVSENEGAKIWNAQSFELTGTIKGYSGIVKSASYSPDGKRFVTASADGTAKIWDAESFELTDTVKCHSSSVQSAVYSPDGRRIVTSSWDKTAKIWDAVSFEPLGTLNGHSDSLSSAFFSPDGKRIVTSSGDGTVRIWDAGSYDLLGTINERPDYRISASFSPDGRRIVTVSEYDHTPKVWDVKSFELIAALELREYETSASNCMNSAEYSPDGKHIITAVYDGTVKIWDAESFELIGSTKRVAPMGNNDDEMYSASYSPDGERIVTLSKLGLNIWDADSLSIIRQTKSIFISSGTYFSAQYSPDSEKIIAANMNISQINTVRIYDSETLKKIKYVPHVSGLNFVGVDFTVLDPASKISKAEKKIIRIYGAKI